MKRFLSWRYRCFSVCTVFPEPWKSCFPLRSDLKYFHARTGLVSHSHHLDVAPSSLLECLRKPQSRRRLWITPQKKKTCPRFRFQARSYLASPGMFSSYCAQKNTNTLQKWFSSLETIFFRCARKENKEEKTAQLCCRNRSTLFKRKKNEKESKTKKKGRNEGTKEGIKKQERKKERKKK